jgi:hypothetical protein
MTAMVAQARTGVGVRKPLMEETAGIAARFMSPVAKEL